MNTANYLSMLYTTDTQTPCTQAKSSLWSQAIWPAGISTGWETWQRGSDGSSAQLDPASPGPFPHSRIRARLIPQTSGLGCASPCSPLPSMSGLEPLCHMLYSTTRHQDWDWALSTPSFPPGQREAIPSLPGQLLCGWIRPLLCWPQVPEQAHWLDQAHRWTWHHQSSLQGEKIGHRCVIWSSYLFVSRQG